MSVPLNLCPAPPSSVREPRCDGELPEGTCGQAPAVRRRYWCARSRARGRGSAGVKRLRSQTCSNAWEPVLTLGTALSKFGSAFSTLAVALQRWETHFQHSLFMAVCRREGAYRVRALASRSTSDGAEELIRKGVASCLVLFTLGTPRGSNKTLTIMKPS